MDAVDVVLAAYDAVERRDMGALLEVFDPACEFVDVAAGDVARGHEAFARYMDETWAALPDYRPVDPRFMVDGNRVAAELDIVATHRGIFLGVEATGQELRWSAAAFYDVDPVSNRITREAFFYDIGSIREQLDGATDVPVARRP